MLLNKEEQKREIIRKLIAENVAQNVFLYLYKGKELEDAIGRFYREEHINTTSTKAYKAYLICCYVNENGDRTLREAGTLLCDNKTQEYWVFLRPAFCDKIGGKRLLGLGTYCFGIDIKMVGEHIRNEIDKNAYFIYEKG